MDSFYFLLQKIREMPGLYLGKKSLEALIHFWNGYAIRGNKETWEKETGLNYFEDFEKQPVHLTLKMKFEPGGNYVMDGFNEFVYKHYSCIMPAMSGAWMILEKSNSDEEALDKFFELLDMFLELTDIEKGM